MRNLILAHSKENREKLPCRRIFGLKLDLRGVWWVRWQNRALARGRKGKGPVPIGATGTVAGRGYVRHRQ